MRKVYWEYFRLGDIAYREKMKYYENHHKEISTLHFEESLDITIDYVWCLFEVGRYERYIQFVDSILETIIEENIFEYRGENIFFELLFKKAACLYQMKRYEGSMKILLQLRKMDPLHTLTIDLYGLCKRRLPTDSLLTIKAIGMAALTIVMSIALVRIFIIDTFYAEAMHFFINIQYVLAAVFLISFLGAEMVFQYKVYKEIGRIQWRWLSRVMKFIKR